MRAYELKFIVESDCLTDEVIDRLGETEDVVCGETGYGDGFVIITSLAATGREAIRTACLTLQVTHGVRVIDLQRDLVSIAEIAARMNQSRQTVHNWINGRRRSGDFPRPFDPNNSIWLWDDVHAWALEQGVALDDADMHYPNRADHDWASAHIARGWSQERPDQRDEIMPRLSEIQQWARQRHVSRAHSRSRWAHVKTPASSLYRNDLR